MPQPPVGIATLPRAWLESQGITDQKQINQIANYASLEWPDNLDSSDTPPFDYVPAIQPRFTEADWARMHELHALPDNWHNMTYADFLDARRKRMAAIIRRGFDSLKHP